MVGGGWRSAWVLLARWSGFGCDECVQALLALLPLLTPPPAPPPTSALMPCSAPRNALIALAHTPPSTFTHIANGTVNVATDCQRHTFNLSKHYCYYFYYSMV